MIKRLSSPFSYLMLALAVFVSSSAEAQDSSVPSSLEIVPQSAAFYMASMNHQAQYDAVVNSRAYERLMESPVGVKMRKAYRDGRRRGFDQFGYSPFRDYLESYSETVGSMPGRMALNYFGAILKNEFFIYADNDWNEASDAIAATYGSIFEVMQGQDPAMIDEQVWVDLLPVIREQLSEVNTPTLVMGTVVDEPALVSSLLELANAGMEEVLMQAPPELEYVYDAYEVIKEDDAYLLSFTLTAEMIPWDEISDPQLEDILPEIKAIMENKSINLCLGTKGKFFVISVGPSNEHILSLGDGPLLIDHEKMKAVKSAVDAGRQLTGVSYMSDELMTRSSDMNGMIQYFVSALEMGIVQAGDQPGMDELIDAIKGDADELVADLGAVTPKPGAYVGFSYMTDEGIDGYVYNWGENKTLDDSAPLAVLKQVGPRPALVLAAHEKPVAAEQYKLARKWCGKLFDYFDMMAPHFTESSEQLDMIDQMMSELKPILQRIDTATAENLIPATEGSQFAFVLDLSIAKSSWQEQMPPARTPVAVPGMAVAVEIQDADQIRKAGSEYLGSAKDFLEFIRNVPDAQVPEEIQIHDPQKKTVGNAEMYYYSVPDEAGLDSDVVPHALLTNDWLYLGYLESQTTQMMSSDGPAMFGPAADASRPAMGAAFYDNRQVVDALYGWCQYALQLAQAEGESLGLESGGENDGLDFTEEEVLETFDRAVDLLRCFHGYSSLSYMEDGAQVTQYQMRFQDVDK